MTQTQDERPHKPADDTEEIYYEGSPMLRWQLASGWPWALIGIIIAAAPIVLRLGASSTSTTKVPVWLIAVSLLIGLILIFVPWIKSKTIRYKISNYRINFERGLLSRTIDTLEMWHVEDLKFHQSILNRLLGVGSITVYSHDATTRELKLVGLPRPREIFDILQQRVIAVKRQRGVVKMDTGGDDIQPHHE